MEDAADEIERLQRIIDSRPAINAGLPEPDEYQYRMKPNWDDRLPWTPWEACSKESAANFRKRKEIHDWIYEVRERYTEQQVRELLAEAACTKSQTVAQEPFGYFKRDSYGWMDCSKDTEGAVALYEAPQPQADARDAQRYRWLIDYFISDRVDLDDALVAAKSTDEISKIIDAAIASKGDSA
jgi:hypothetical protein